MKEEFKKIISDFAHQVDYFEIRLQCNKTTEIAFVGKELESIGVKESSGGNIRVFWRGRWGFVCFDSYQNLNGNKTLIESDLRKYAKLAIEQVKSIYFASENTFCEKLASAPKVETKIEAKPTIDPRLVPLSEKHDLCYRYNQMILSAPKIVSSKVTYRDRYRLNYYMNSDGSYIEEETISAGMTLVAFAKDGNTVQPAFETVASQTGFDCVQKLEPTIENIIERAVGLLSAPVVKAGVYTVIIDPKLCGLFVHEAFGHLSEADYVFDNPRLREIMTLGRQFGVPELNIVDDATVPNHMGNYKFDDEGVPGQKTYLIKNGILVGRLHSKETAMKMNEPLTGNARAINYRYPPIVRMSCTYLEPGGWKFEDMVADTENGLYVKGALAGNTNLEMFTFSSEEAFIIKNGVIGDRVRDVILSGNVFETLKNIDAIGNDLQLFSGLGGCGKDDQSPLPVSDGGPHIRIRNVVIGGV